MYLNIILIGITVYTRHTFISGIHPYIINLFHKMLRALYNMNHKNLSQCLLMNKNKICYGSLFVYDGQQLYAYSTTNIFTVAHHSGPLLRLNATVHDEVMVYGFCD